MASYPNLGDDDRVGVEGTNRTGRKQTMTESTEPTTEAVQRFNGLSEDEARTVLSGCLAAPRWVEEVAGNRPYPDADAVLAQAETSARSLSEQEVAAALAHHPRIGELPVSDDDESRFSSREQSGVDHADLELSQRLVTGNAAYEARFGQVFLIRAKGRDARQILCQLERRLGNDERTEAEEVARQLREIAVLRLQEVLTQ
jgi:2-oxo-4-hydroxy-4-carboxy-5-ureidoimidazoline decarboxylase